MNATHTARSPWPLAIIAWFIVFAVFLASFVVWAVRQREDLVAENYYEREVRYQQQLDRLNNSRTLDAASVVMFDRPAHRIIITLPAAASQGATGRIHLYRPSDARLDREVPLALDPEGVQLLDVRGLQDGLWKVRLEWSANGRDFYLDQAIEVKSS